MSSPMKVGVIGLGIMGGAFARNLLDAGFSVTGYDIDPACLDALLEQGGFVGDSPSDIAAKCDVVITSLPSVESFHAVTSGKQSICDAQKRGLIVIECSTLSIEDKQTAHDAIVESGCIMLDCPVSGTGAQAQVRDLSIYISGDKAASDQCNEIFTAIAKHSFHVGEFGNGSKMKFVANVLVHIHNVASAEAMVLAMKAGLDPHSAFQVLKEGAGNSRIFELRAPMMVENNYSKATMKMDVWQKDIQVIGEFAESLKCPMPLFSAGTEIYHEGMKQNMDKLDTASVCRVLEKMAGIERSD